MASKPENPPKTSPGTAAKKSAPASRADDGLPSAVDVLRGARAQLSELIGMPAESVSSFERTDQGWQLKIEVLELSRVPDTMSLLASYEVELAPGGELTGYRRLRRYERGRADRNT
ncbi:gas vesicle protein [Streptomyces sp. NPDC001691]|uniref:gas vesicle protein GvpO n=1 Tax=unclassified Streptomyces TaxID=2593676 RepID=UPI000DE9B0E7|nr:gas vesicle protein [Streptomyces sp. SDr-06]RCH68882.1 gas vesicle protein [Streptomyces sp. SDr-06]